MKKSSVKYYIVTILIFILFSFVYMNKSYAESYGWYDLWQRRDLYCIEHGGALNKAVPYDVARTIQIEGNNCTYDSANQWTGNYYENGVMAYLLAQGQGYSYGSNPNEVMQYGYSSAQWALWSIVDTYLGNSYIDNSRYSSDLLKSAYEYAKSIGKTNKYGVNGVENNTEIGKLKTELYEYGGNQKNCIRFGPFKLNFSGNARGLTAKDENGVEISNKNSKGEKQVWFYILEGGKYKEIDPGKELVSGQDFFVDVRKDAKVSKISGFSYYSDEVHQDIPKNSYKTTTYDWKHFGTDGYRYGPFDYDDSEKIEDLSLIDGNGTTIKYLRDKSYGSPDFFHVIPFKYAFGDAGVFIDSNPRASVRGDSGMQMYIHIAEPYGAKGIKTVQYKTVSKFRSKDLYDKMDLEVKKDYKPYAMKQKYYWGNDGMTYYRVGPFKQKFTGTIDKLEIKDQNGNRITRHGDAGNRQLWASTKDSKGNYTWFSPDEVNGQIHSNEEFYIDFIDGIGVSQISEIKAIKSINARKDGNNSYGANGNLINDTDEYVRMGPFTVPSGIGEINDILVVEDKGNYVSPFSQNGGYRQLWVGKDTGNGNFTWCWPGNKESIRNNIKAGQEIYIEWVPTGNESRGISKIVYQTNKKQNIKIDYCGVDLLDGVKGEYYTRTGPFNLSFSGEIESINVLDQNGNVIPPTKNGKRQLWFSYKNGDEYNWFTEGQVPSNIISGQDFYIDFPIDSGITSISGFKGKNKVPKVYTATLYELRNGYTQGLLRAVTGVKGGGSFDFHVSVDVPVCTNIGLKKVNEHNGKSIEGVTFKVRHLEKEQYISSLNNNGVVGYTSSEKDAMIFKTDANGEIKIPNVLLGTYQWIEIENPYYGYQYVEENNKIAESCEKAKGKPIIKKEVLAKDGKNAYEIKKFTNAQRYVKISGYVWEDIPSSKQSNRNNRWKEDRNDNKDIRMKNIKVSLKNRKTGEIIKHPERGYEQIVYTPENGEYIFNEVEIDNIANYYVEFEYDGLIYECVPYARENYRYQNASKASEWNNRRIFNDRFGRIDPLTKESVRVYSGQKKKEYDLNYNLDTTKNRANYGVNYLPILSNTENIGEIILPSRIRNEYITNISNINLGVYKRRQADLALMQDLEQIKVGIKGYDHIYKYASRFKNGKPEDGLWDVGVKFGSKYKKEYLRPVYKADYEYQGNNAQMTMTMTYKIVIRNESDIISRVNSIVGTFDSCGNNYKINNVGTELDYKNDTIIKDKELKFDKDEFIDGKYVINISKYKNRPNEIIKIKPNESLNVYVQFELDRKAIENLVDENNDKNDISKQLKNVAEINSYTSYDGNGELYAAYDVDSVPGNKDSNLEDDVDFASGVRLVLPEKGHEKRKISGIVFEDNYDKNLLKDDNIREGNGKLDSKEAKIGGVKVELFEVIKVNNEDKLIKKMTNGETRTEIEDITNDKGEYTLEDFEPGNYRIRFTWGDGTQKIYKMQGNNKVEYKVVVENYKATVFDKNRYENFENNNSRFYQAISKSNENYTHAIDNWSRRIKIDNEQNSHVGGNGYNYATKVDTREMFSDTCTMTLGVEDGDPQNKGTVTNMGFKNMFEVKNVSFGLIERPKQKIEFVKRVSNIKIKLADGRVLVDANIGEDGKLTGVTNYVTYQKSGISNGIRNKGFVKVEMDAELMQTSDLEVTYKFIIKNTSEADFINKGFYNYGYKYYSGDAEREVVKLAANKIVDYLDSGAVFMGDKNDWKEAKINDFYGDNKWVNDDVIANKGGWNKKVNIYKTEKLKDEKLAPRYKVGGNVREDGQMAGREMKAGKTLTQNDDINFINEAEIVEIDKPFGSKIECVPGNYEPTSGRENTKEASKFIEMDTALSEQVKVMPSTGGNGNMIMIITLTSIGLLGILGIGIYFIKKKALKK